MDFSSLRREIKAARDELTAARRAARTRGDADAEAALTEAIEDMTIALADVLAAELAGAVGEIAGLAAQLEDARALARRGALGGLGRGGRGTVPDVSGPSGGVDEPAEEEALPEADKRPAAAVVGLAPAAGDPGAAEGLGGALTVTEAHLIALWRRNCFPIDARGVIVFGVRGATPVDFAGTGIAPSQALAVGAPDYRTMRCTIGQWRPGAGFAVFPGSTVPFGATVEAGVARNGVGVNQLGPGRYGNYEPGWHKRGEGERGHWALRQECPITLQRTGDDAEFEATDRCKVGRIAGDNIHCAFSMGPLDDIPGAAFSSAGCQVVAGTVQKGVRGSERGPWAKFIAPFQPGAGGPSGVDYVLLTGPELRQMVVGRYAGKTVCLRFGSTGPLVRTLQRALADRLGRAIEVDGDFGPATFLAVLDVQTDRMGAAAADGVVGPDTAAALGLTLPGFDFADAIAGGSGQIGGGVAGRAAAAAAPGPLAWGAVTAEAHGPSFGAEVRAISGRLGCDPSHLMALMAFETGETFAPDVRNRRTGAIGLIQFTKSNAVFLGTTDDDLAAMGAVEQLAWVERHLKILSSGRPLRTLSDLYMTVVFPVACGKEESFVLFREGEEAYRLNKGLDARPADGVVTKAEAAAKVEKALIAGMQPGRLG